MNFKLYAITITLGILLANTAYAEGEAIERVSQSRLYRQPNSGRRVVRRTYRTAPRRVYRRTVTSSRFVEERPIYVEREPVEEVSVDPFLIEYGSHFFASASIGYAGLKGEGNENTTVFKGINYSVGGGYRFSFISFKGVFEGSNHWLNSTHFGRTNHDLYSLNLDIRSYLSIFFLEPFLELGIGSALYHTNAPLMGEGNSKWGIAFRIGAGIQFHFQNFGIALGYGHRWYNFGANEENDSLKMQVDLYRTSFSYYF